MQLPKPSASICLTIATTRFDRSTWPCGNSRRCETFAATKSIAEAFLHAATHAPHPMQAAASIAGSASSFEIGIALPSGAPPLFTETNPPACDDPVEGAAIDDQILDDGEGLRAPRLDRDGLAVLEMPHVQLADGRAAVGPCGMPLIDEPAHAADAFAAIASRTQSAPRPRRSALRSPRRAFRETTCPGETSLGGVGPTEPPGARRAFLPPDLQIESQLSTCSSSASGALLRTRAAPCAGPVRCPAPVNSHAATYAKCIVVAQRFALRRLVLLAEMAAARLVALGARRAQQFGKFQEIGHAAGVFERSG